MTERLTPQHYALLGKKGKGKSTLMRYLIDRLQKDNPRVEALWTNATIIGFNGQVHTVKYLRQLERSGFSPTTGRYGIVAIDELSKALPSRRVGGHNTEIFNLIQNIMNRLRKRNCYFIYTDQWTQAADIMVRNNVDYLWNPCLTNEDTNDRHGEVPLFYFSFEPTTTDFNAIIADPNKNGTLLKTEMNVKDLFPLFKSEEVIPLTYNPPFKVETWTKNFMLWCAKHGYVLKGMKDSTVRNVLDLYQIKKNAYITNREVSAVLGKLKVDSQI